MVSGLRLDGEESPRGFDLSARSRKETAMMPEKEARLFMTRELLYRLSALDCLKALPQERLLILESELFEFLSVVWHEGKVAAEDELLREADRYACERVSRMLEISEN